MEAKGSSGQSTAYNTYATLLPPNPLYQGFSRSQNVNKEIIISAMAECIRRTPEFTRGVLFICCNSLEDKK